MSLPIVPLGVSQLPIPAVGDVLAGFQYGPIGALLTGTLAGTVTTDDPGTVMTVVAFGVSPFIIPPESIVRAGVVYGSRTGTMQVTGSCTEQFSPASWLKDEWQWVEGVADAGFQYGPQTYTTGKAAAPGTGVKVRRGNPSPEQIAIAASTIGYENTDQLFTIWSNTLRATPSNANSTRIYPQPGDLIIACGRTWIIKSLKETMYDTQYIAYCRLSTRQQQLGIAS